MKRICVCDFSLKQLSKEGKGDILFREKLSIASRIAGYGVDTVELAPVTRPKEDIIIYKTIASALGDCIVTLPAGTDKESIEIAWECIKNAKKPCLQISLPVAAAQMEYSFRAKEEAMLENIKKLVGASVERCELVEFEALDATRADREYLIKAFLCAEQSGASAICLCDDAGVCLPDEIFDIVSEVKKACSLPLYVNLSNSANMALANAVYAIKAGADGVKTSVFGEGVLLIEQLAQTLDVKGNSLDFVTSLKLTEIHRDIKDIKERGASRSSEVRILSKDHSEYDVYLDTESSLPDVVKAINTLGYELSDEDCSKVRKAMLRVCEKKSSIGAKELEALIAENAMQVPSTYHLLNYAVNCGNMGASMAQVSFMKNGETMSGVALGDGPVDSAFRAIEQSIGYHYELDDFQISTLTRGKESLGSAVVILRTNGKLYSGNGISTDIVGASIRAYINALNKIVYEEK